MNQSSNPASAPQPPQPGRTRAFPAAACARFALVIALAVILAPAVAPAVRFFTAVFAWDRIEKAALEVLRSESLAFLVTDRIVTQIAVEITDGNPLLGKREGILIGTVSLYYGVDLRKLDASCLSRSAGGIVVTLPDPEELVFSVDPASLKFITKRSGLNVIVDFLMNKDIEEELRRDLHAHAVAFMTEKNLIPARDKIVRQINEFAPALSREIGASVEFR